MISINKKLLILLILIIYGLPGISQNDTTIKLDFKSQKETIKRKMIFNTYPIHTYPDWFWEVYDVGVGFEYLFNNNSSAYITIKSGFKNDKYEFNGLRLISAGYRFYLTRNFLTENFNPNDYYLQKNLNHASGLYLGVLAEYYYTHSKYLHHNINNPEIFGMTTYRHANNIGAGISFGYQHILFNRIALHLELCAPYIYSFSVKKDRKGTRYNNRKNAQLMINMGIGYAF